MTWEFNDETPIYLQIIELLKMQIASGVLKPNDKIPSVRELSIEAGVNPNTMQKALSEMERQGLLVSQRTSGRFVADTIQNADTLKQELAKQHMQIFCDNMKKIGYTKEQSLEEYRQFISCR